MRFLGSFVLGGLPWDCGHAWCLACQRAILTRACCGTGRARKSDLAKDMQLTLSDLSDSKTLAGKSDGDIFDIIRKGKDKMPPEDPARAKDDDVWNLVIYVRSLAKNNTAAAAAQ